MLKNVKRTLTLIGLVAVIATSCLLFAACSVTHTHTLQEHKAVAACTEEGYSKFWSCVACGKIFSDAEGKNETTLDEMKIAPTGHKLEAVVEKAPTCTDKGHIAYWRCTNEGCDKCFSDAEGKHEIKENKITVSATQHDNIQEVKAGIDVEAQKGWHYHWYCEDCDKYFADSFGDIEMDESVVYFEPMDSVSITVNGKKDGKLFTLKNGTVTLTSKYNGVTAEGTIENGVLTLKNVYPIAYTISCDRYVGEIMFETGTNDYAVELRYMMANATGPKADTVDLTHSADEEPYIIINNKSDGFAFAQLVGTGDMGMSYYLQANIKINSNSFSTWSDIIYFVVSDGDGQNDSGFALWMSLATDHIHICRYNPTEGPYDGKGNDATSPEQCLEITSALYGNGLNIRVFRNDETMTFFYENEKGEWVKFYTFNTCGGDAQLAIGAQGASDDSQGVTISQIKAEKLTYHAQSTPSNGGVGYMEHFTDSKGVRYNMDGIAVDDSEIVISVVPSIKDATNENLTDKKAYHWRNPLYWEIYTVQNDKANIATMPDAKDLIDFDFSDLTIYNDDGETGVILDGNSNSPFRTPGTSGGYNDISITVGKDARRIDIWTGAWLARVKVSLYEGSKLLGVTEFEADWETPSVNKYISFAIDNSAMKQGETKTYTLRITYISSVSSGSNARVRLGAIAVMGKEAELTYHDEEVTETAIISAHYTDAEGNYYTVDKVLTTLAELSSRRSVVKVEDAYDMNLSKVTDVFTVRGEKVLSPEFTYHGFRYMKMTGADLPEENVTALVRHTDMKRTGTICTNNERFQRLYENVVWGQRGNFVDLPTDCPQRDERLGWTGDINAFCRTAAYNYDVRSIIKKWLADVRNDQAETGEIPTVAPDCLDEKYTDAMWCDSITMVPWTMYEMYGDLSYLADNYVAMEKFIAARERNMVNGLVAKGHEFGDWLALDVELLMANGMSGRTDAYFLSNVFHSHSLRLVAKTAELLGDALAAELYQEKYKRHLKAVRDEYFTANGRLVFDTVTAQTVSLYFDIVPEEYRNKLAEVLNENVIRHGYRMVTGFIGTPYLLFALADHGYWETARRLLLNNAYPGWLYEVDMGATTVWERWNSLMPDGTPNPDGMNSYNHYAYGSVMEFAYRRIAGIDMENVGFRKVKIAPHPLKGLPTFKAEYNSAQGMICSGYEQKEGKITFTVSIPETIPALLCIPNREPIEVVGGDYRFEQEWEELSCESYTPESTVTEVFDNPIAVKAFNEVFGKIFVGHEIAWMKNEPKTLQFMAEFRDMEGKMRLCDFPDMLARANCRFRELSQSNYTGENYDTI